MEETLNLKDIRQIIKRRFIYFLIPFLLITAIGIGVAMLLPPVYQSTGIIMIEAQEIPLDLVRTTVTGYAEERIQRITQQIMGRTTLVDMINKFGLFKESGKELTEEAKLEKLRDAFNTEMISAEIPDERTGRVKTVNVAFSVSAEWENRQTAMQMANFLVSKYLEHNLKERQESVKLTSDIIERQLADLEILLEEQEKEIADYKIEHQYSLPDLYQVNLQTEAHLRRTISDIDSEINSLKDRKVYLEGQLATVNPNFEKTDYSYQQAVLSDEAYLAQLQRREVDMAAKFSDEYPDLIKIRKEIAVYEIKVVNSKKISALRNILTSSEQDYVEKKQSYTDQHPEIIALIEEIKKIKKDIQQIEDVTPGIVLQPDNQKNPAYVNLQTQIRSTGFEIENLMKQREERNLEWQEYMKRLEQTPITEKAYQEMTRGYSALKQRYEETVAKHLEAKNAETVEARQVGEKFTVIEPPLLPEKPFKPNRLAIALISIVLGIGGGVGLASVTEFTDTRIRTPHDIETITELPILGVISDARKISSSKYGKLYSKYAGFPQS